MAWASSLIYYDSVRGVSYDDWRLPITGPLNGNSLDLSFSYDGSTDTAYNVSAPGSAHPASKSSEMAYLFYQALSNKGYCPVSTVYACSPSPQPGWGLINTGPFTDFQSDVYWSNTEYAAAGAAWFFVFGSDEQAGDLPGYFRTS
jgi:hypothetical protein